MIHAWLNYYFILRFNYNHCRPNSLLSDILEIHSRHFEGVNLTEDINKINSSITQNRLVIIKTCDVDTGLSYYMLSNMGRDPEDCWKNLLMFECPLLLLMEFFCSLWVHFSQLKLAQLFLQWHDWKKVDLMDFPGLISHHWRF